MKTKDKLLMEQLLKMALEEGADHAEVIMAQGQGQSAECRLGKTEAIERSDTSDIGLTVYLGKQTANVASNRTDPDSFGKMVDRVIAMAKLTPEDPYIGIATPDQVAKNWAKVNMLDSIIPTPDQLIDLALETEESAMSVKGVTNSEGAESAWGTTDISMISTNGFYGNLQRSSYSISVSVIAGSGSGMETDFDYSATSFAEDLKSPKEIGINAGKRAVSRLNSKQAQTGNFPIIFDSRVSRSIANHIASSINGSSVARGTSMFQDQMNSKILNSSISVVDDPKFYRGHGSVPFDSEGLPTVKREIISNGILNGWLLDLSSAKQLELKPTGNAKRRIGGPASPGTSNFMILSGKETPESIRSDIKSGLLITQLIGSSVNLISGNYSRGASGFWIENGELTNSVSEITVAGNLKDMFLNLTAANDLDKSHSIMSPTLRVESMMVAGN